MIHNSLPSAASPCHPIDDSLLGFSLSSPFKGVRAGPTTAYWLIPAPVHTGRTPLGLICIIIIIFPKWNCLTTSLWSPWNDLLLCLYSFLDFWFCFDLRLTYSIVDQYIYILIYICSENRTPFHIAFSLGTESLLSLTHLFISCNLLFCVRVKWILRKFNVALYNEWSFLKLYLHSALS